MTPRFRARVLYVLLSLLALPLLHADDKPVVFWASSPVAPGQTVMVQGWGWGNDAVIEVVSLPDSDPGTPDQKPPALKASYTPVTPVQCSSEAIAFLLPGDWQPGVFQFRVKGSKGVSSPYLLNAPTVWWCQGDNGTSASPGGWLRIFGVCLSSDRGAQVALTGGGKQHILKPSREDSWTVGIEIPGDLPVGEYKIAVHNGQGGPSTWTEAGSIPVASPPPVWREQVFEVSQFNAIPNDAIDDTHAIQQALDAAGQAGGGIVSIPFGRFQLNGTLTVPQHVLIKGAGKDLTMLYWRDDGTPLDALIRGTNSFGVEDMSIMAANHLDGIASDGPDEPGAGNVFLRRLYMRLNRFDAVSDEILLARFQPFAGATAIHVNGDNVQVTDCFAYSSHGPIHVNGTNMLIRGNEFFSGDSTYSLHGRRIIFEENTLTGGVLARGGGVYCRKIYYGHNRMGMSSRHDGEILTSDGTGHVVVKADRVDQMHWRIAEDEERKTGWNGFIKWQDGVVRTGFLYIVEGKGSGQIREVVSHDGLVCEIDRPWAVEPDTASSLFLSSMNFSQYMLVGNEFHDATIVQSYSPGVEWLVAENTFSRIGGFRATTRRGEPIWRMLLLGNEIIAGNNSRGPLSYSLDENAELAMATKGARFTVFRDNKLHNNSSIAISGSYGLVEDNVLKNTDVGIKAASATLVRRNTFENVTTPIRGQPNMNAAEKVRVKLLALPGDLANAAAKTADLLGSLATKPLNAPGLVKETQSCLDALAESLAKSPANGTLPLPVLELLTGEPLSVNVQRKPMVAAYNVGGKFRTSISIGPSPVASPLGLALSFPAQPLLQVEPTRVELTLNPGKRGGTNVEVVLQPGVSTAFTVPFDWELTNGSWKLKGKGQFLDANDPAPVTQWAVCGPFPNDELGTLDKQVRGPERRLDLAARHQTLEGMEGWQKIGADKLDFTKILGRQRSASAFAVTVLRARKPTPFALTCRVRAGELTVNGVPRLLPRNRQVSGTLRQGNNIVMLKVANQDDAWTCSATLSVPAGTQPGDVTVVPVSQLETVAELNPPARPPIPQGKELPFSDGIDWRLVYNDDFDRSRLGADWAFNGTPFWAEHSYKFTPGELSADGQMFSYMSYDRRINVPLRVEFDFKPAKWNYRGPLLSATLTKSNEVRGRRLWGKRGQLRGTGYMLCLGWHDRTTDQVWRDAEEVVQQDPGTHLEPGKWHHVVAQFAPPKVRMVVDGKVALEYEDQDWIEGLDTFSFFSGFIDLAVDNVRVYQE